MLRSQRLNHNEFLKFCQQNFCFYGFSVIGQVYGDFPRRAPSHILMVTCSHERTNAQPTENLSGHTLALLEFDATPLSVFALTSAASSAFPEADV
jgi:hypothetical protein